MTTYVGLHDDGKSSVQGFMDVFSGLFGAGVNVTADSASLKVVQRAAGANMSIDVSVGKCLIDDTNFHYPCWIDAVENKTVTAADASNPRKDIVVAYVDHAVPTTSVTNNTGALKFAVVAGTPAASPTEPSSGTIQTAVGSGNPWIYLALVDVAASSTTVVDANITDRRADISLNARTAGGWEELGRTTLGSNGDTIDVTSIASRKYLKIIGHYVATGGTADVRATFNSDTSTNYSYLLASLGTAYSGSSTVSQNYFPIDSGTPAAGQIVRFELDILNIASYEKQIDLSSHYGATGGGNFPTKLTGAAKWANTSNQINSFTLTNVGTGDLLASLSEVVVLGRD